MYWLPFSLGLVTAFAIYAGWRAVRANKSFVVPLLVAAIPIIWWLGFRFVYELDWMPLPGALTALLVVIGWLSIRADMLRVLPVLAGLAIVVWWWATSRAGAFPIGTVPSPYEVVLAFGEEIRSFRLAEDIIASLYRVAWGYITAVLAAVPLGLVIARSLATRTTLMPLINFCRNLSPIAWIPFAIVWFGVGDPPAIFIIFLATFFQIVLATAAAAAGVPKVYYRVAEDMELSGAEILFRITLPAIMPQLVTALRIAIGVAWMVVVAAEMIAVRSGLGFLIVDARNGLRMDLVVCGMIVIGTIGIALDVMFARLAKIPSVRWGFER